MKFALFISTLLYTATVLAAPGAISLNRSFKTIAVRDNDNVEGTVQVACIECPCGGFTGACECVSGGCCCDDDGHVEVPEGGWKA